MCRGVAVAILMIAIATGLFAQSSRSRGVVEFVDGDVHINGMPADFGQAVEMGDFVQTGPASYVDIVFDRTNIFRLGENTVAVLELGSTRQEVDLKFGTFAAVFDRIVTLGTDGFNVRTPTTVAGVRGTSFFIRVIDSSTTYQCTCNGSVHIRPEGNEEFVETAAEHSAYYITRTGSGVTVKSAAQLFHDNESLDELAAEVGVTIPWGSIE
jgi:hypothetical protein